MSKKICEKTVFNILLYRKHQPIFTRMDTEIVKEYDANVCTLNWVKEQSKLIDTMGFDNWFRKTGGPSGVPAHMKLPVKYSYSIRFRRIT